MSKEAEILESQTFSFQTEIKQLLHLLIHSLYTKREIFLRELVSNASDALNKVQFEQITNKEIVSPNAELAIHIDFNETDKTLTVRDTGIGMTREELIKNLGTIAHSGSRAFLNKLAEQKQSGENTSAIELIGQFGVGFYSVFMVADKVSVTSKSMIPGHDAWTWVSEGEGSFTIESSTTEDRGTNITIHLKEDATEFLSKYRLEEIIKRYSNYVAFPVYVNNEISNRQKALWAQSKSDITQEMYDEFYGHLNHCTQTPLAHLHLQADVPIQFSSILYVPHEAPIWYSPLEQKHGLQLYVKKVFIQEDCEEVIPKYLRFMKGVVDVDDLPLNVSREVIQKNPVMNKIQSNLTRKTLQLLSDMAEKDADKYQKFWKDFGMFLKEGAREDFKNKDSISDLLRFNSSYNTTDTEFISLADYVGRMPEGQNEIYYFTGANRDSIERSPHLERFRKSSYEVLYLTDAIDPLVIMSIESYKDKKFRIIDDNDIVLPKDENITPDSKSEDLIDFMKKVLGDRVENVTVSNRLVDSPACLANAQHGMKSDMQRLYSMMDKEFKMGKRILEINPSHPTIQNLAEAYSFSMADPLGQEKLRPFVHNILDTALLAEGLHPNPSQLVQSLNDLLKIATSTLITTNNSNNSSSKDQTSE